MKKQQDVVIVWEDPNLKTIQCAVNQNISMPGARHYLVDDDYDFGSIDPSDLAIEMYIAKTNKQPGIILFRVESISAYL